MTRIFITGTNRGIGLALVRQLAAQPENQLFAACRNPADAVELQAIASAYPDRVTPVALEVTDEKSIQAALKQITGAVDGLDLLINNAAINPPGEKQRLETITAETMLATLHVNAVAPLIMAQACLPLLRQGDNPRIVNISSDMGSIAQRYYAGDHAYGTSKAALNMLTRGMALELRAAKICVISLDPGWVQTDMGSADADLTPAESAQGMVQVVAGLTMPDSGSFLRWNGDSLPW